MAAPAPAIDEIQETTGSDELHHFWDPADGDVAFCGADLTGHAEVDEKDVNCRACLEIDGFWDSWDCC